MRGGIRPGSGRPKRSSKSRRDRIMTAPAPGRMSPLDYMLAVMNDPGVDDARRDGRAIAAAPYVHPRAADATRGTKKKAQQAALPAARGRGWEAFLEPPILLGRG